MKKALIILGVTFVAGSLYAQVVPPPTTPPPSSNVPLDPFSWVILSSGGVAAVGKYYQIRKKK